MTAAPAPRLAFLPDLLEIHFGELQLLWRRRRLALRSPEHTPRTLAALDERVAAHTQGLVAVGGAVRALVEPALVGDDEDAAFAAAHALLRLDDPDAARAVARAVARAEAPARRGLTEALSHGPAGAVEPLYAALVAESATPAMAVATEVLAFRGALRAEAALSALGTLVADGDAGVRAAGWRAAGHLAARLDPAQYEVGWDDAAPAVRRAALEAAAWAGVPTVIAHARRCAARPAPGPPEALYLLAVLAEPHAAPLVAAVALAPQASPTHLALLGTLGAPAYGERLAAATADPDPTVAAAAGAAFAKLTGQDVGSARFASLANPDADAFDAEFADVVRLPDRERALAVWADLAPSARTAARLCRGVAVGGPYDSATADALDLESRWEYAVRARYAGAWSGRPADLERLSPAW